MFICREYKFLKLEFYKIYEKIFNYIIKLL